MRLLIGAVGKFLLGLLSVGLLVFLPAGTLSFSNGWLLILILFIPMLVVGAVLMVKNPALLKSRLDAKEKQKEQDTVVKLSGLMFLAGFVTAGVGFRFGWYMLPKWAVAVGAVLFLTGYALYAEVLRENTYLSRTIGVQEGQRVIDTGLYGVVRHPMYSATVLMFLSIPIVLGSLWSLLIFSFYLPIIARRIHKEEAFLEKELVGYTDYKKKVKYRLIPFIW